MQEERKALPNSLSALHSQLFTYHFSLITYHLSLLTAQRWGIRAGLRTYQIMVAQIMALVLMLSLLW
jgi:hypothetical protein